MLAKVILLYMQKDARLDRLNSENTYSYSSQTWQPLFKIQLAQVQVLSLVPQLLPNACDDALLHAGGSSDAFDNG